MTQLKVLCVFGIVVTTLYGIPKTPIAEEFTGTWCQYCPGAARGLDELYERSYDTLIVVAYHYSDAFSFPEGNQRISYYSISGYPTTIFNGTYTEVGGLQTGTMYPFYRRILNEIIDDTAVVSIDLDVYYDSTTNSGTIQVTMQNYSNTQISGNLISVVIESGIPYNWFGLTTVEFVARAMPSGAYGTQVTLDPSSTYSTDISFTIDQSWNEEKIRVIVIFQNIATREIYNSAMAGLLQIPDVHFYGLGVGTTSNGDMIPEPGDTLTIHVYGRNMGSGPTETNADITIIDPHVTILGTDFPTGVIFPGQVSELVYAAIEISPNCPSPYMVEFNVEFPDGNVDTIPFMISDSPGLFEDFESGVGSWSHSGTSDYWHLTEHRSYSPTHSFYCGYENAWVYPNQSDASLISPYFVIPESARISVAHFYSLEVDYDYAYIEIDNGSGFWRTLETINGNSNDWVISTFSLSNLVGQTSRLRFRFVSDYSVTMEGWYVDNVGVEVAIEESSPPTVIDERFSIFPNPIRDYAIIKLRDIPEKAILLIIDLNGRVVNSIRVPVRKDGIKWKPYDKHGNPLHSGIYFITLKNGKYRATQRIAITR